MGGSVFPLAFLWRRSSSWATIQFQSKWIVMSTFWRTKLELPTSGTRRSVLSSGSSKCSSQGPPKRNQHVLARTASVPPSELRQFTQETQTALQELTQNTRDHQLSNPHFFADLFICTLYT